MRAPEPAGRALEPNEKTLESARRVSGPAGRALMPAEKPLEPAERAPKPAGRPQGGTETERKKITERSWYVVAP